MSRVRILSFPLFFWLVFLALIAKSSGQGLSLLKHPRSAEHNGPPVAAGAPGCNPKRNYSLKSAVSSQRAAEQEGSNLHLIHSLMQIIHTVLLKSNTLGRDRIKMMPP